MSVGEATKSAPSSSGLNGWHVLMYLAGFFGIVFAVNGYFLYSALSTYTGTVANEPYRKGLAYNSRIAAEERQETLHWADRAILARDGLVTIDMTGPQGDRVQALQLSGVLSRPVTAGFDHKLAFKETGPGHYEARVGELDGGTWVLSMEARERASDDVPAYQARRRLWLKP